jgi:hypothetical protein
LKEKNTEKQKKQCLLPQRLGNRLSDNKSLIIVLVEKIEKKQHSGVKNVSFFCLDKT